MSRHIADPMGNLPMGAGPVGNDPIADARPASFLCRSRRTTWAALLAGALLWAGSGPAQAGGNVCRVETTGADGNDGSSWAQAMDLQSALGSAACLEIWVAEGVYKPTAASTDPAASFAIRPGVAVYGGFAGSESNRDERDPAAHRSVLSGDIDGNDAVDAEGVTASGFDILGTNAYHVVRLGGGTAADTVLDGFTLTGGLANRNDISPEDGGGGGLLCNADGAGQACSPTLRNLAFRGNGGISGGGVCCVGQNQGTCGARLENVAFVGNFSLLGGGMLSTAIQGGASHPSIDNATFSGNFSAQGGAGFGSFGGDGGSSNPILRNVTFNGNDATTGGGTGGAVASLTSSGISHVTLVNAILWGDVPDEVVVRDGTMSLNGSIVQGGCPPGANCSGAVVGDPLLGPLQYTGTTPVLPLGTGSAALDAVACDDAPTNDARGVARPQGRGCDVGALEVRQAHLAVAVSGAGKVGALATPPPLGAAIADCRQDQGICDAWYRVEPEAPAVTLALHPDAGGAVQSASGCGGSLTGNNFITGALAGDCGVSVVFAPATHTIGGTVTGLAGSGLVLALNGSETLPVDADGAFAFDNAIPSGDSYDVTVNTQPSQPAQACVVVNGSGTIGAGDVTDVVIHCGAAVTYSVGGTLSGLAPGAWVALSINGGDELTLAANGAYAFAPRFAPGDGYLVALTAQPAGQHCTLSRREGVVGSIDVTDVDVNCAAGGPQLQLTLTDGSAFARYGHVRDYFVTLANTGNGSAQNVAVGADLDPAFDEANVLWTCVGGEPGAVCAAQGAGGFADTATLPPGTRLVWIVSAPIRADSDAAEATFAVHADGAADASDTDTLVLFRDGVDVPYGDGAEATDPARAAAARDGMATE